MANNCCNRVDTYGNRIQNCCNQNGGNNQPNYYNQSYGGNNFIKN